MQKQVSSKVITLTFGVLAICFTTAFYIIAWQEPSQQAPDGNVEVPINVSSQPQAKSGSISAPIFYDSQDTNYYLNPNGNSKLGGDLFVEGNFPGLSFFGDGSDGDVIISTTTSIGRDMFYNNLIIESGVTLTVYDGVIFIKGTLINRGIITTAPAKYTLPKTWGPAPGKGGAAGSVPPKSGESVWCGGNGGNGGRPNPDSSHYGHGGSGTLSCYFFRQPSIILMNKTKAIGAGGGAGWCSNNGEDCYSYSEPGAGGNGGGGVIIFAKNIDNAIGIIQANGMDGEDAYDGSSHLHEGGGGGGGGGAVILIYNTAVWGVEQALGGKGGKGVNGAGDGEDGSAGVIIKIANQ